MENAITSLKRLNIDVHKPLLLEVWKDFVEKTVSEETLIKIVKCLESYIFRRTICEIPTNSLNKIFANLYKEINPDNYFNSFKSALTSKDSYRRFHNNREFE